MQLVLITPEHDRSDEPAVLDALFAAGLERCHVRKPHHSAPELAAWIDRVPSRWHARLVLHQHHELVAALRLGGRHWRDLGDGPAAPIGEGGITSRSCHDLATLRAALGRFDAVFFGPVFPSISKPGYGPKDAQVGEALGAMLHMRTAAERRTAVIALGGITATTAARARVLGFDGVAVLGAVWQATDPIAAFAALRSAGAAPAEPARPDRSAGTGVRPGAVQKTACA